MESYREQMARTRRYYERFKELNDGKAKEPSSEANMDDIYAFFQNCYHLKDWLKNDPAYTFHSDKKIEEYVTQSRELSICADICNGSKHLSFDPKKHPPRSGAEPKFGWKIESETTVSTDGKVGYRSFAMRVELEHAGARLDAFQLATVALESWESLLKEAEAAPQQPETT